MNRKFAIPAALLALLLLWLLFPSKYSRVRNLQSNGTNIIAFGDSLTAGYGAGAGEDYPAGLARAIGREVINAGVSGDTTDSALARIDADVLQRSPRVVIVGLGGNDFLRGTPIASTEANLRNIVKQVQASGAMVVILGFNFPSLTASYGKMYKRVASDEGCLLIPDLLDGIIGKRLCPDG
jgi:lysophospholipase L1-like esterase